MLVGRERGTVDVVVVDVDVDTVDDDVAAVVDVGGACTFYGMISF